MIANPEAIQAIKKRTRIKNADAERAYRKRWYAANKEYSNAASRAYHAEHQERRNAAAVAWMAAHPEQAAESSRRSRARRAQATRGPVDAAALWTGLCGICGDELDDELKHPDPFSKSLDHVIPLSRGGSHTQDNLQWAHLRCNLSKGARMPE